MAQKQRLRVVNKGLYTMPSDFSPQVPDGAMHVAENVVIDREDIVESRRGFDFSNPTPDGVTLKAMYSFMDKVIAHMSDNTVCRYSGTKTFIDSNVNITTDVVTITAHGFTSGDRVQFTTTGTLPTGISLATSYYVYAASANTIQLFDTAVHAVNGVYGEVVGLVNITAASGGGTHTISAWSSLMSTPATISNPDITYGRIKTAQANKNLYIAGSAAINKLEDSAYPSTIKTSGISQPSAPYVTWKETYTTTYVNLGVRTVVRRLDANGNLLISKPSDLMVEQFCDIQTAPVIGSGGGIVYLGFDINSDWIEGDAVTFYAGISSTYTSASPDLSATPDNLKAYVTRTLSAADITAGYVNQAVTTFANFSTLVPLDTIYTSLSIDPKGILQANDVPLPCKDLTNYKNYTFYANAYAPQTIGLAFRTINQLQNNYMGFEQGGVSEKYWGYDTMPGSQDFSATTYWTREAGWTITGGQAVKANTASSSDKRTYTTMQWMAVGDRFFVYLDIGVAATVSSLSVSIGGKTFTLGWDGGGNRTGKFCYSDVVTSIAGNDAYLNLSLYGDTSTIKINSVYVFLENATTKKPISPFLAGMGTPTSEILNHMTTQEMWYYYFNSIGRVTAKGSAYFRTSNPRSLGVTTNSFNVMATGYLLYVYEKVVSSSAIHIAADYVSVFSGNSKTITTTHLTPTVDANLDTFTFVAEHGLITGDRITFHLNVDANDPFNAAINVGSSAYGASGTYYAIKINNYTIKITNNVSDALGNVNAIDLLRQGSAWTTNTLSTNKIYTSSQEGGLARIYYSKLLQPEHVPALNYLPNIGGMQKKILRVLPLRESLIVLKEDGIYRVTGYSPENFAIDTIDNTVNCLAPDSAVVLNNTVFALTNQGVVKIADAGVKIVSRQIESDLMDIIKAAPVSVNNYAFGIAYETDRKYILSLPTSEGDTHCSVQYVYNHLLDTWTKWTLDMQCSIVNSTDDKIYFGDISAATGLAKERKTRDRTDYIDKAIQITVTAHTAGTKIYTLSSASGLVVGDLAWYSSTVFSLITAINGSSITLHEELSNSPTLVYKSISCVVEWHEQAIENPASIKQFKECSIDFKDSFFDRATLSFRTNQMLTNENMTIEDAWTNATSVPITYTQNLRGIRVYVPRNMQKCGWLVPSLSWNQAYSLVKMIGLNFIYEHLSTRLVR